LFFPPRVVPTSYIFCNFLILSYLFEINSFLSFFI
jgi:hypothetical protein